MSLALATVDPAEMSLAQLRLALAPAIAESPAYDGWSMVAVADAAQMAGVGVEVGRERGGKRALVLLPGGVALPAACAPPSPPCPLPLCTQPSGTTCR